MMFFDPVPKNITKTLFCSIFLNLKYKCNIVIMIFSLSVISMQSQESIKTNDNLGVSNKKIEWGIKRNDNHEQPDVGKANQKILEENDGICLGNKDKKYIYLTFDEGYEAGYTSKILETLKNNDVKAAFFLTAHYVNTL